MNNYIESLHVENSGPFDKLNVQFNPSMNVIAGVNGVGKTSILKYITLCLTNNHSDAIRERVGAHRMLRCVCDEKKCTFDARPKLEKDEEYRLNTKSFLPPVADAGRETSLVFDGSKVKLLAIGAFRYLAYQKKLGMKSEDVGEARKKIYSNNNPLYVDSTAMPDIKQWMINRYFVEGKEWAKTENANWAKLNEIIAQIGPDGKDFHFEKIERPLEPMFSLDGKICYLEELSSGYKSVLSMIFIIIDWIEGVNDGDDALIGNATGTVLIDEIDLHLHPSWQAKILDALRAVFPKLQFIVTTHSPYVLMSARQSEVMVMTSTEGEINLMPMEGTYSAWTVNNVLTQIMGAPDVDRRGGVQELILALSEAYEIADLEKYDAVFAQLKSIVSPNDDLITLYNLKRSSLLLKLK